MNHPNTAADALRRRIDRARGRPHVEDLFRNNTGPLIHKVPHYFEIYERHLRRYQRRRPVVLEIGVFHGGSLRMWERYFGPGSVIVGLDLDPRAAALDDPPHVHVRVGDQSDPEVLAAVAAEFGPFDVVIDDGGHIPAHQLASLEHLWPHVRVGGTYLVEDLMTNYWPEYGGGPDAHTFMDFTRAMVDEINAFNSRSETLEPSAWTHEVTGMHVYDGVVVLDRGVHEPMTTEMTGRPTFTDEHGEPYDVELTDEHRARLRSSDRRARRRRRVLDALPAPIARMAVDVRRRLLP